MATQKFNDEKFISYDDGTTNKIKAMIYTLPLSGVVDTRINLVGENRTIKSGQTGDYTTDFGCQNQHLAFTVNSIITGGDIVITGTSISEGGGVPSAGVVETITVDTTTSKYQTDKKWLEITNIDISSGTITGINYDIEALGYLDFGNSRWILEGYRVDMRTQSDTSDFAIVLDKIQDDGNKKYSHITVEDYGHDSVSGGGKFFDGIRTAGDNRDYTMIDSLLAPNNCTMCYKCLDFATYFTNDENVFDGNKNEGLIIKLQGKNSTGGDSGIRAIDFMQLTLFYRN